MKPAVAIIDRTGSVIWFLSKIHEGDTALIFHGGHRVQIDPDHGGPPYAKVT